LIQSSSFVGQALRLPSESRIRYMQGFRRAFELGRDKTARQAPEISNVGTAGKMAFKQLLS
jgi:hypothetical protein